MQLSNLIIVDKSKYLLVFAFVCSEKMDEFTVIDDEFSVKKKKLRLKELITQMIYRREINETMNHQDAFRFIFLAIKDD